MANYYASCRTNYFQVKDSDEFMEAMAAVPSIEVEGTEKGFVILGACADSSGWPSWVYNEETGEDIEIDLPLLVSEHLKDDEVAIFMEAGAEKLRYVCGYAEAINNKGERRSINLNHIYELASELGSNITDASY